MTILFHAIVRICKACCLKKHITVKYQISVFYVPTSLYGFGPNCQDLGLISSRNDRTLGWLEVINVYLINVIR